MGFKEGMRTDGTKRAYAELVEQGGTRIRFYYPDCGHTSVKDYSKGPVHQRMGAEGCAMMASWWSKEKGGTYVSGCPKCKRQQQRGSDHGNG